MKRVVRASTLMNRTRVVAAGEDEEMFDESYVDDYDNPGEDLVDTLDDVSDAVEDIQDTVDEVEEDDINIETDNNIAGHYIAECDTCHGVFISATMESDQVVEKVTGICPLCQKETEQYLKWVIRDAGQE